MLSERSYPHMHSIEEIISAKMQSLKESGRYRYFLEVNKSAQHFPHFYYRQPDGTRRSAVNWCSNDYLAMSTREELISKLSFTAHKTGTGSSGTRNISGTTVHHRQLEETLASWHGKESALLFNSAYQANLTSLQTLGRHIPELIFISDERNHASLIEGMRAAGNEKHIFRHNDVADLERILQALPPDRPRMVVFESVYSMSGSRSPLKEIIGSSKKYGAMTYVDEVHAVGLYGPGGSGLLAAEGLDQLADIINGTLSKAIGVFGGYIAGSALLVDFLRSHGPGFIFTTSLPPAICAAAAHSIELIQTHPEWRALFHEKVRLLRAALTEAGVPFEDNPTHITPVRVGDSLRCRMIADALLLKQGIYLQPINPPTVPAGEECLRIVCTLAHEQKHIHHLAISLKKCLHGYDPVNRQEVRALAPAN